MIVSEKCLVKSSKFYQKLGYDITDKIKNTLFLKYGVNSINFHNRIRLNKELCTICNPISETNTSISEKEVYKFIKEIYEGEVIQSYRDGLEIDIHIKFQLLL